MAPIHQGPPWCDEREGRATSCASNGTWLNSTECERSTGRPPTPWPEPVSGRRWRRRRASWQEGGTWACGRGGRPVQCRGCTKQGAGSRARRCSTRARRRASWQEGGTWACGRGGRPVQCRGCTKQGAGSREHEAGSRARRCSRARRRASWQEGGTAAGPGVNWLLNLAVIDISG